MGNHPTVLGKCRNRATQARKGLKDSMQGGGVLPWGGGGWFTDQGAGRESEPSIEGWKRWTPRSRHTQVQDSTKVGL